MSQEYWARMTEAAAQGRNGGGNYRSAEQLPAIRGHEVLDWMALLEDQIGLSLSSGRTSFLVQGLRTRMHSGGFRSYGQYYRHMCSESRHSEEWSLLADALTVHETRFFRHGPSMRLVRDKVRAASAWADGGFQAWSVGCATGEEVYSLAMLIDSCRPAGASDCPFRVTGTDLSESSLRHAKAGVYLRYRARNIHPLLLEKYCRPVSEARFAIHSRLQKRVRFFPLNVRDVARAPFGRLDLIFCQNLLIYYGRLWRLQVVDSLAEFLRPGGVLVLAPGEIRNWHHPHMEKVRFDDTLAYRRTD
jgi:type IV pilus assembly protein PilK